MCSVIVEAVKVDSLQRLCSSLEPLLRRIVSHKVIFWSDYLQNSSSTKINKETNHIKLLIFCHGSGIHMYRPS